MKTIFDRIKEKSRRFIPFTVDIEGEPFNLYVRRASSADAQEMQMAWEKAYQKARAEYKDTDEEQSSLYALIQRQQVKALANFISQAEEEDRKAEASTLSDDAPCDDEHPEVKELAKQLMAERTAYLESLAHEDLVALAMNRRIHFNAAREGNAAQNRTMAALVIYADELDEAGNPNGNKVPLFESAEAVEQYPLTSVVAILAASKEALDKERNEAPLT